MFDKSKVNFIIDVLMFLIIMAIAGMGFLMKYILIPGKEVWIKYGNVDLSLLGMDRHEWGKIHHILGFILLGLLILHIILHWKMVLNMFRRLIGYRRARIIMASVFIIICAISVVFPFIGNPDISAPEVQGLRHEGGRHEVKQDYIKETKETEEEIEHPEMSLQDTSHKVHCHTGSSFDVRGYMSLAHVAEKYDVPIEYLKKHLGIQESAPGDLKLGWLRKKYSFRMSDVERVIDECHKSH